MVTASPAVLLREAASRMRALAEAATPGPWAVGEQHGRDIADEGWSEVVVFSEALPDKRSGYPGGVLAFTAIPTGDNDTEAQADAAHIAAWHPAVALAVANWLDEVAALIEFGSELNRAGEVGAALDVARVFLGTGR